MSNGNTFRRDQRAQRRQQNQWANRQFADFRRAAEFQRQLAERRRRAEADAERRRQEAQRRAEAEANRVAAQRRMEAERRRQEEERRVEAEARLREEQERAEAEAEARRQHKEQLRQARILRRQQAREAQERARQLAEQQRLLREQAERQAQQQLDQDNATLALLQTSLGPLRQRANGVHARAAGLVRILTGSGAAELAQLQLDVTALQQISQRCAANVLLVATHFQNIRVCAPTQINQVTRAAVIALQQAINDRMTDDGTVTTADVLTTQTELTYQADRQLIARYPNLGLTRALLHNADGPTNQLSAQELAQLNTKLAGHTVTAWVGARLPQTRNHRRGDWLLVPQTLNYFPYQPSSEVFHDWVWQERIGHGQPAAAMVQTLNPIRNGGTILGVAFDWAVQAGKHVITHRNVVLRVVLDNARAVLITYFRTQ
jgi:hypothetical protein